MKIYTYINKMKKIIIFTPVRTGSTLLYNIIKEFFPNDNIKKVHSYQKGDLVFTSIRDPRDSALSLSRVKYNCPLCGINEVKSSFNMTIRNIDKVTEVFKYEDFYNNPKYWIEKMKKYTDDEVSLSRLIEITSPSKRKKFVDDMGMNNFNSDWDKITLLHAKHIGKDLGKTKLYKQEDVETQKKLYNELKHQITQLGYE